jgi:esterase/lipase superfamily enzyme
VKFAPILFLVMMVAACAPRGMLTLDPSAVVVGDVSTIFVGTTRAIDPRVGLYGAERSETVLYSRFDVSIPPDRELGDITWPKRGAKPNPNRDFVTTRAVQFTTGRAFASDLRTSVTGPNNPRREAVIFVHGFNTTFSEGLYRLAQLAHDLELPGTIVHYSWASNANALGYVHDRDSALFARDGLEQLISEVQDAGAEHIYLVAHSLGSTLTMEAVRQIAIRNDVALMNNIDAVALISPDIDVDVFRSQALSIGPLLPNPFVIFGSEKDFYLNLSGRLTGEKERLGNLSDVTRLADLKVTYFDVSNYSEGSGHFNLGDSPTLIRLFDRVLDVSTALNTDQRNRVGLLPGVILTVRNATQVVLAPVVIVGDELSGR